MPKYKSKIYAKALADLILDQKNQDKNRKIINNFLEFLVKNGDIKKSKEIISLIEAIFLNETGGRKITVETARKIDNFNFDKIFNISKNDSIEEKVNPKLIAGIKVIVNNEKQLDFSLKRKLEKIFI